MNKRDIVRFALSGLVLVSAVSCSDELLSDINSDARPGSLELNLQADIDQINVTRADDNGFADGDKIGIYAVNYVSGAPADLLDEGNQATNVGYRYSESSNTWTGDRQLYFKDDKTPVDIYGYYPYNPKMTNVRSFQVSVERDQSVTYDDGKMGNYEKSDLLMGKTPGVTPATPLAIVTFRHALAGVKVTLLEGDRFQDGEWAELSKDVMVCSTVREGRADLATGTVVSDGEYDGRDIKAAVHGNDFRAVVVPQTVEAGSTALIINVGRDSYRLIRDEKTEYPSGKMFSYTIRVNRKQDGSGVEFALVSESVTPW